MLLFVDKKQVFVEKPVFYTTAFYKMVNCFDLK
jgi:hypothetical protein